MEYIEKAKVLKLLNRFDFVFEIVLFWIRMLYPKAKGIPIPVLMYFLVPQKILRINGGVPWPVHFTSRVLYRKNIKVGNRSAPGNNSGCYIQGRGGIIIGHNCRIGPGVGIISANHDPDDYDRWIRSVPISIGDNVWIGMNAVILPGVSIGNNVIIGANSVVRDSIPSSSIASGNPCKVVREKQAYRGLDYSKL